MQSCTFAHQRLQVSTSLISYSTTPTNSCLAARKKIQCIVKSPVTCFDWNSPAICVFHVRQVTFQVEGARAVVAQHQMVLFTLTHPALIVVSLILLRGKRNFWMLLAHAGAEEGHAKKLTRSLALGLHSMQIHSREWILRISSLKRQICQFLWLELNYAKLTFQCFNMGISSIQ